MEINLLYCFPNYICDIHESLFTHRDYPVFIYTFCFVCFGVKGK